MERVFRPIVQKASADKANALIGQKFGKLTVQEVLGTDDKSFIWVRCKCDCGNVSDYPKTVLLRKQKTLECIQCGMKKAGETSTRNNIKANEKHIGEKYGELTILEIVSKKEKGLFAKCLCSCGNETVSKLSAILNGTITSCGHESRKNVEVTKDYFITDGTLLTSIDGRRKVNKNSSTGYTGISKGTKGYRAYIYFRRKQYNLGTFKTLEEAIEARKEAEQKYYEPILKNLSPDVTEKLKSTKRMKEKKK